jgi:hypothetical protein
VNDTIVIKYTIELVVSTGGALSRSHGPTNKADMIKVPPSNLGHDLGCLFASSQGVDYSFDVEGEEMGVHKIILEARSPVFRALINSTVSALKDIVSSIQDKATFCPLMEMPRDFLASLMSDWLGMDETARLDMAMSERRGRELLLEVLGSGKVVYEEGGREEDDWISGRRLDWLGKRGVGLRKLRCHGYDEGMSAEMVVSMCRNSKLNLKVLALQKLRLTSNVLLLHLDDILTQVVFPCDLIALGEMIDFLILV